MKRLIIGICAVSVAVAMVTAYFYIHAEPKSPEHTGYTIYVLDNGAGYIEIDNINAVQQLHEDVEIGGKTYKAGTVIIPGDGNEIYYEYPHRDSVNMKGTGEKNE